MAFSEVPIPSIVPELTLLPHQLSEAPGKTTQKMNIALMATDESSAAERT